jgi:hypothetical protein
MHEVFRTTMRTGEGTRTVGSDEIRPKRGAGPVLRLSTRQWAVDTVIAVVVAALWGPVLAGEPGHSLTYALDLGAGPAPH